MNRRQLLVVAIVIGLLVVGWMLGQPSYELHRELTLTWRADPSAADIAHPADRPSDATVQATVGCPGPLAAPDAQLDVRSPGLATAGFEPWQPVYEPNPCIADRADRRHRLELAAAAVLVLGVLGLVIFRPRPPSPSNRPGQPVATSRPA